MQTVLVAGASGYLGHFLVKVLQQRGYRVRALTRPGAVLPDIRPHLDSIFIGKATQPATLRGVADGTDVVISALGITRQRDGLSYQEVDYLANLNLLREAQASGVKKFIYVSLFAAGELQQLAIVQAKERFVRELRSSGMACSIIRPNGYFSDMRDFLAMAERGRAVLFGTGSFRINPIHGRDVAAVCVDAITEPAEEISFGGPVVYTHREIAEAAFRSVGRQPRFLLIPCPVASFLCRLARLMLTQRFYGPFEFALTVYTRDLVAEQRGKELLTDFFQAEITTQR